MEEKYLPLGTVVMLQNGTKAVMIIGYAIIPKDNSGVMYDYMGCLYPEGIISTDESMVFNHSQIASILYKGFVNNEQVTFIGKLKEVVNKIASDSSLNVIQGGTNENIKPVAPVQPNVVSQPQMSAPVQSQAQVVPQQPINNANVNINQPVQTMQMAQQVAPSAPVQAPQQVQMSVPQQQSVPTQQVQMQATNNGLPQVAPDNLFVADLPTE